MKHLKVFLLQAILLFGASSNAQEYNKSPYKGSSYYLYSSEDRVYFNKDNKWEPVIYEETPLENETKIKTNAPFTVIQNTRLFFCPEARVSSKLSELINNGKKRNKELQINIRKKSVDLTSIRAVAIAPTKCKFHNLLIGFCDSDDEIMNISSRIKQQESQDNDVIGYNKVLANKNNLSKDSILSSLKSISDSIGKDGYIHIIVVYISSFGFKDKEGKYHFMTSNSEYDSLTCNYTNTIPVDTINSYVEKLKSEGADVYVFINSNHTNDLVQNIYYLDNCYALLWTPLAPSDKGSPFYVRSMFDIIRDTSHEKNSECNIYYNIYYKE